MIALSYAQCSNVFGVQKFKWHYVPFNCFTAQQRLNTTKWWLKTA